MSSSSASSWERVPSDYDILSSSPTDSIGDLEITSAPVVLDHAEVTPGPTLRSNLGQF